MTGIVGFCGLAVTIDLLPFLVTENLGLQTDFSGIG